MDPTSVLGHEDGARDGTAFAQQSTVQPHDASGEENDEKNVNLLHSSVPVMPQFKAIWQDLAEMVNTSKQPRNQETAQLLKE